MLTLEECRTVLKTLKNNKAPGNDGIPVEFYKKFFPLFGHYLVDSFNQSYTEGELTASQKQAVITLLDKGKDRTQLKNWRPISLLNVDYKIASKAITNRLIPLLPSLIHTNQVGYVKRRNITDNIRSVIDIMEYLKDRQLPGIMINIDFEKAFDSVNWLFLETMLQNLNFGPSFIKWIKTFYTNISSCITNNGYTSNYFPIQRGVRQGDPLSPYLFILVVEMMACKIRQDERVEGIKLNDTSEIKLLQYADDTNGLLKDLNSARHFLRAVEEFGSFSGLKLNKEKTEAMWLGSNRNNHQKPLGILWPDHPLKILGIYASYDKEACIKLNFEEKLDKAKRIVNMWMGRNLTIYGRIQIIKTFIQSQFLYVSSVIDTPKEIVKKINHLIFKFVWRNKTERLKRTVLIKSIKNGGLQVPDFETMLNTVQVKWIKKLSSQTCVSEVSRLILESYLKEHNVSLNLLLYCNFNIETLNLKYLPTFYYNILKLWSEVGNNTTVKKENLVWYNRNVCVKGQSVFYVDFFRAGLWYIQDLYTNDGSVVPFDVWVKRGVKRSNLIKWMGLVKKCKHLNNVLEPVNEEPNLLSLMSEGILGEMSNRHIYIKLLEKKTGDHLQVPRIMKYIDDVEDTEWMEAYVRGNKIPVDTKTKAFQYRFLQDLLSNRYWLHKWRSADSPICLYCNERIETIEHMFWDCNDTVRFWGEFKNYWISYGFTVDLNKANTFFGVLDTFMCNMIFTAKRYIYNKRIHNEPVLLRGFEGYVEKLRNIELKIATDNERLQKWTERWSYIQNDI